MSSEVTVVVGSYPNRVYAEAIVDDLQESGIGAVVVPSDDCAGLWDVEVPAGDAVRQAGRGGRCEALTAGRPT